MYCKTLDFEGGLQLRSEHRTLSGETPSEAHCQSSFSPGHNDTKEDSSDRDRGRQPGDIQLRKKDTTTDSVRALYTSKTFKLKRISVS